MKALFIICIILSSASLQAQDSSMAYESRKVELNFNIRPAKIDYSPGRYFFFNSVNLAYMFSISRDNNTLMGIKAGKSLNLAKKLKLSHDEIFLLGRFEFFNADMKAGFYFEPAIGYGRTNLESLDSLAIRFEASEFWAFN